MTVQSNDNDIKDLLVQVGKGELQLPDFQRSWVWDDSKICKLIESITMGYPMGALMFLETGGEVNYKPRLFAGVDEKYTNAIPDYLVLDGQQRLTTLYQVFMSKNPVETCFETSKGKTQYRYYYLDIKKALDDDPDMETAIISIPTNKIKTSNIGRNVELDLSTRESEFENMMFPLNLMFSDECYDWLDDMEDYITQKHGGDSDEYNEYKDYRRLFRKNIIESVTRYKLPVIKVLKSTSLSSVCQIFENVNRGGVPLDVFELVTASLAAEGVELREEWNHISENFANQRHDILKNVDGTHFLTSMTLWDSYENHLMDPEKAVKCKKKDVMNLRRPVFEGKKDGLEKAFVDAATFIINQGVYTSDNLPYNTQLIPLSAIFAYDNSHKNLLSYSHNREKLSKWYWCGVFGELYGSALETRYALDIREFFMWITDDSAVPNTVSRSNFQATRLLSLKTRNSAAYKGVMALIIQGDPLDFASAQKMSVASYTEDNTDIHHIFPVSYCEKEHLPVDKWDSVVNKTLISAKTNRSISGAAPNKYIEKLIEKNNDEGAIKNAIRSHKINFDLLNENRFDEFIVDRAISLLNSIEAATGKTISGRDSQETIEAFGASLERPE